MSVPRQRLCIAALYLDDGKELGVVGMDGIPQARGQFLPVLATVRHHQIDQQIGVGVTGYHPKIVEG